LNENLENAASVGQGLLPMTATWKSFLSEHAFPSQQATNLDQQND
jgi:hypothetical protein